MTWCNVTIREKGNLLVFFILCFSWHSTFVPKVTEPKIYSTGGHEERDEGVQIQPEKQTKQCQAKPRGTSYLNVQLATFHL